MASLMATLLLLLLFVEAAAQPANVTIEALLVDGLVPPLLLAASSPRFSWTLASARRNSTQSAYQIIVSSSAAALGDIWDSGVRTGSEPAVDYAGPPLIAGGIYYASGRAWIGNTGPVHPPSFSPPVRFGVGLQQRADWAAGAEFIGLDDPNTAACPWLRSDVFTVSPADIADLRAGMAVATLHVASVGYHVAFVNGDEVDDGGSVLAPSVSDLGARVPAVAYDVSQRLVAGSNVVALWLGPGWGDFVGVNPVMTFNLSRSAVALAELRLASTGGGPVRLSVFTAAPSWRASPSSVSHHGAWTNSDFGGDAIDWRADQPGWATPLFNASSWRRAVAVEPAGAPRAVTRDAIEPTKVIGRVPATAVAPCASKDPGCYVMTMAELFVGFLQVAHLIPAVDGEPVTMAHSSSPSTELEFNQLDSVIPAVGEPVARSDFVNRFSYHEIHYVTFRGLAAPPALADVVGLRVMNARRRGGTFACALPLLDAIYAASVRTYEGLNAGGMSVDCPHRERLGYGGDMHTTLELALSTWHSAPYLAKVQTDWADVQSWSGGAGAMPHTAPTIDGGGGPAWGGIAVVAPWESFRHHGDIRALLSAFPTAIAFTDYLLARVSPTTGLLEPFGDSWAFLGDWVTPHGSEESGTPASILFNNCYLSYILQITAKMADALGDAPSAASLRSNATAVGAAMHAAFYNASTHAYLDGLQGPQVMPLVANAVPPALVPTVLNSLVAAIEARARHVDTGLHGTYFMTKLLTRDDVRRDDLLFDMLTQTSAPSLGALLAAGYTTWPEKWDGAPSRLHGCLNGFGLWFPQGLLGVRAEDSMPGFARFTLRPAYGVGGLAYAQGAVVTPRGDIAVAWRVLQGGGTELNVSVPANSAALIYFPGDGPDAVLEGGIPAATADGVRYVGLDPRNHSLTLWSVGSGSFEFNSTLVRGAPIPLG